MSIDKSVGIFRKLVSALSNQDLYLENEATTRKRVIDEILEKVLGWSSTSDITYEERVPEGTTTTFADYIVRTANTAIIIEAKKYGEAFILPSNRRTCILGGSISKSAAGIATQQARDYARKKAIPFAVVTNGRTWIVFPAVRTDGVSFEQTQAHIFQDFEDIDTRFVSFYELLSKERVVEGSIEHALFGQSIEKIERRLISVFREPGFRIGRNSVYEHIEPAVSMALTDEALLEDTEGLEFCYVRTSERIKYDSRLNTHLIDIKPTLERKVIRPRRKKQKEKHLDMVIDRTEVRRQLQFIMILGPVGAGKTTFLEYTRQISSKSLIDSRVGWFYVDFKSATNSDDPRTFIYSKLLEALENDNEFNLGNWDKTVEKAYSSKIKKLEQGALALLAKNAPDEFQKEISKYVFRDREQVTPYVQTILGHFSTHTPAFLVIDNVDQIDDLKFQEQVFLETQAAARAMGMHAIISLRDATYVRHKATSVFDAFQLDTIYIDPPQVVPVLSRRFAYAKQFLDKKSAEIDSESGKRFIVGDLSVFFDILTASLLNEETGYLLEVLSSNNIRRGLGLIRNFLASGHTTADRALSVFLTKGKFYFGAHEFFKGAIFAQRQYYREEESLLANIFDSKLGHRSTQLLRLVILCRLKRLGIDENFGGLPVMDIEHDFYQIGISRELINDVLNALESFGLIKTTNGQPITNDSCLVITRFGAYCIQELSIRFYYFEPCMIDSNILDDQAWENLQETTQLVDSQRGVKKIEARIERARIFQHYLKLLQDEWTLMCNKHKLASVWCEDWMTAHLFPGLELEFKRVVESANWQYQRGN